MTKCITSYKVIEGEPVLAMNTRGEMSPVIRRFRVHFDGGDLVNGSFDTLEEAQAFGDHWMALERSSFEWAEDDEDEDED